MVEKQGNAASINLGKNTVTEPSWDLSLLCPTGWGLQPSWLALRLLRNSIKQDLGRTSVVFSSLNERRKLVLRCYFSRHKYDEECQDRSALSWTWSREFHQRHEDFLRIKRIVQPNQNECMMMSCIAYTLIFQTSSWRWSSNFNNQTFPAIFF